MCLIITSIATVKVLCFRYKPITNITDVLFTAWQHNIGVLLRRQTVHIVAGLNEVLVLPQNGVECAITLLHIAAHCNSSSLATMRQRAMSAPRRANRVSASVSTNTFMSYMERTLSMYSTSMPSTMTTSIGYPSTPMSRTSVELNECLLVSQEKVFEVPLVLFVVVDWHLSLLAPTKLLYCCAKELNVERF